MLNALKIKLAGGKYITINEENVSSAGPIDNSLAAELRMNNGDVWICEDPPYKAWENDALKRKL